MYLDREKISAGQVTTTRIIQLALAMGVAVFLAVCLILYFINKQEYDPSLVNPDNNTQFFMIVFVLVVAAAYANAFIFPRTLFNKTVTGNTGRFVTKDGEIIADECVGFLRTVNIIRLALLEGAAFFGLIFLVIHIRNLQVYADPVIWVFAVPAVIMILFVIMNIATRERIASDIELKIIPKLQENSQS